MTLRLAPLFEAAVGLDPDPGMLAAASEAAARQVQNAGFRPAQTVIVPDRRVIERTADDIVAQVFSSSGTAPHLFGDRRPDFERDLRTILARASPAGRFSVRLPDNILRIWRRPGTTAFT